ncbi:MAG: universal stress protein [Betaproteobacteria bacterium]|nr:MAG: universal stress protein [Betaproteobacteria bacterium]
MSKILVAVDGSSHSSKVARTVIRQVSMYKKPPELHLTYVHLPLPTLGGLMKPIGHAALERYYREEGEDALRGARKLFDRAKLACAMHIIVGPVAETLAGQAKKLKCDLIVMGTHGMGAVAGMLLGSVAAKTVHMAHCPVLLVRE